MGAYLTPAPQTGSPLPPRAGRAGSSARTRASPPDRKEPSRLVGGGLGYPNPPPTKRKGLSRRLSSDALPGARSASLPLRGGRGPFRPVRHLFRPSRSLARATAAALRCARVRDPAERAALRGFGL